MIPIASPVIGEEEKAAVLAGAGERRVGAGAHRRGVRDGIRGMVGRPARRGRRVGLGGAAGSSPGAWRR